MLKILTTLTATTCLVLASPNADKIINMKHVLIVPGSENQLQIVDIPLLQSTYAPLCDQIELPYTAANDSLKRDINAISLYNIDIRTVFSKKQDYKIKEVIIDLSAAKKPLLCTEPIESIVKMAKKAIQANLKNVNKEAVIRVIK